MNLHCRGNVQQVKTAAVLAGSEPEVLAQVLRTDVEFALWHRQLPVGLSQWLDALPAHVLPTARLDLDAGNAAYRLHLECENAGMRRGEWRDALVADMVDLMGRFARVTGSSRVRLRLEAVADNACRRFHRDCVPLRLVTTYRGPGTDWVTPEFADQALACPDDYAGPKERLAAHDVAFFKGCGFPGASHDRGIVHRSPPIVGAGTDEGITRLVLCLNVPPGSEGTA